MKHYQSLEAIKAATVEELASIPSMNQLAAEEVYNFFRIDSRNKNKEVNNEVNI